MKDKEKEKEKDAEKNKKKVPPKKARDSKRSPKIDEEEEETPIKAKKLGHDDDEEPDDDELDEEIELDEEEEVEDVPEEEEIEAPPIKSGKSKRMPKIAPGSEKNGGDPGKPATRLALIRARHESMKREIDQIREDLDSDEEE